jgi:hypothetical protein
LGGNSYFDYKYLTNSDFCFLFQENSPNTVAALCEAIQSLKLVSLNVPNFDGIKSGKNAEALNKLVRDNVHRFKECEFDISKLSEQIKNEAVQLNRNGNYEENGFKLGYCSHLIARANLLLQNDTIKNALGIEKGPEQTIDVINKIESFISPEQNQYSILRIGFEKLSYDFAIREIVVDFIASNLLKKSRRGLFVDKPMMLFIDEAHQFLNKRINAEDNSTFYLQNIDLIAKECRKYGLFLCLATQMPRDIPIGTLSQMGTFIVHRLINEQDKRAIESAASSANKSALSFLPILGEGEALLVGVDFPMPLLIKIDRPKKEPQSNTPKLKRKIK